MALWVMVDTRLPDHDKLLQLAGETGLDEVRLIGHLTLFWSWVLQFHPDGDLTGISTRYIERGSAWEGEAGAWVKALIATGFIDADGNCHADVTRTSRGRHADIGENTGEIVNDFTEKYPENTPDNVTRTVLTVHNWHQYSGRLVIKKRSDADRQARKRAGLVNNFTEKYPPKMSHRRREEIRSEYIYNDPVRVTISNGEKPESHTNGRAPATEVDPEWDALGSPEPRGVPVNRQRGRPSQRQVPLPNPYPFTDQKRDWLMIELPEMNPSQYLYQHELFCEHYWATGETLVEWEPKWRSWMRRAVREFAPVVRNSPVQAPSTTGQPYRDFRPEPKKRGE